MTSRSTLSPSSSSLMASPSARGPPGAWDFDGRVDGLNRLLDLHEDLLTNCAAQAADAPTLCRLSCSCKVFERLVLRDAGAAELAWTPAPALAPAAALASAPAP